MTKAQLKVFFRAVSRAASALGLVGRDEVEEYRHAVMSEEVGVESARDIDPCGGFDRVMYRLATDAGDWSAASRYATGEERRMAHLVEQCARQVVELRAIEGMADAMFDAADPGKAAIGYVIGVMRQADYPVYATDAGDWWLDISGSIAFQVFRMLDTHRRRILKRYGWRPLSFDPDASWYIDGCILAVRPVGDTPLQLHVGKIPA